MIINEKPWQPAKSLKNGFCGFCAFVRGHRGDTSPYTRMDQERDNPIHNNKYNNNIYIIGLARGSVLCGGVA